MPPAIRLLLLVLVATAALRAQTVTLDNFNNPGATGAVIAGTSWVNQVTRNADSITVGGTARDDSGWQATGQSINGSTMTHLRVIARRDPGHESVGTFLNIQLIGANDIGQPYQLTVATSMFTDTAGQFSTVDIPLSWPAGFNSALITEWNIGGGRPPLGSNPFRMTFEHLSLIGGAAPTPPTITVEPPDRAIGIGTGTTLSVTATSTSGALTYQWRKDGQPIAGATQSTLAIANATLASAGLYRVDVSNDAPSGPTPSRDARVTVFDARPTHALAPGHTGYLAGGTLPIASKLVYAGTATGLRWSAILPSGWTLAAHTATGATLVQSNSAAGPLLEWTWTAVPASPVEFTYTLNVPVGTEQDREIAGIVTFTQGGVTGDILATPDPLVVRNVHSRHSADTDADLRINLLELTRVIELFNTRNGTVRTGAYDKATVVTEDGYVAAPARPPPGSATIAPPYHAADSNRDGRIDLIELTRVIALYNYREGTVRTGRYHREPLSEDGFDPGP